MNSVQRYNRYKISLFCMKCRHDHLQTDSRNHDNLMSLIQKSFYKKTTPARLLFRSYFIPLKASFCSSLSSQFTTSQTSGRASTASARETTKPGRPNRTDAAGQFKNPRGTAAATSSSSSPRAACLPLWLGRTSSSC